ncbi:hypothetical protein [Streptomyces sp. NPDC059491]|uniref:hypothetical protein n=1 Tax=Streptomyces sp. NPDC059491 TaxID=3346850 RepID=UPI003680C682
MDDLTFELAELTATHDGIVASLGLVLHALADAYDRSADRPIHAGAPACTAKRITNCDSLKRS